MALDDQVFKLLTDRLDRQDEQLHQILQQVKITNGTVRDHETRLASLERSRKEQAARRVRRSDHWRTRAEVLFGGLCVLLAGAEGERLIHLLFG